MKYKVIKPVDLMNIDNKKSMNSWARNKRNSINQKDAPQLSSAINVKQDGYGRLEDNSLGYIYSCTNTPNGNLQNTSVFSSTFSGSNSNGYSIFSENIRETVALFTARKTIKSGWTNWNDEYSAPNEAHPEYQQWNNDCFVYSLFESKSNQSSLRQVEYKGELWDILNHFFFMSCEEIKDLAK